MRYSLHHLLLILLLLTCSRISSGRTVDAVQYGFPITNPFEATIAGTPADLRPTLIRERDIRQKDYSITLHPERAFQLPRSLRPVKQFRYRLAQQPGPAPIVFLIAGTGANYTAAKMEYLKRLFYGAGYHVVQVSSPTSYEFMVSASRSATPGITSEDALDLYRAILSIRAQHHNLPITQYNIVGYSLGALEAAYISDIDETTHAFNLHRVVMINPPVNLYTSTGNLDLMARASVQRQGKSTFYDHLVEQITLFFHDKGYIDINEAILYEFQHSPYRLSDEEMAMLIGSVFRLTSANIVFTSDLLNKRGRTFPPTLPLRITTPLEPYFRKALSCDFNCYIQTQILPYVRETDKSVTLDQLIRKVGLFSLEDYLRKSPRFRVMHNADDPILGPGDLSFLNRALGDRLIVYPHGGHCGNIDYRVNAEALLEFLRD